MLRRRIAALVVGAILGGMASVVLSASPAWARCWWAEVNGRLEFICDGGGNDDGDDPGNGNDQPPDGQHIPCTYTLADPQPPWGTGGHSPGDGGAWYVEDCTFIGPNGSGGATRRLVWLINPVDPVTIAWRVIARIKPQGANIGIVPDPTAGSNGLVGLPVWMWTTAGAPFWGPISDSDSEAGVTVSVTAYVERFAWDMGDGHIVDCVDGAGRVSPGTPYNDSFGKLPSPTCGHTYARSSKHEVGGRYAITATSYWRVDWRATTGAGGTIRVTRSSTTSIRIAELQVVIG